jgi:hypothetical protein
VGSGRPLDAVLSGCEVVYTREQVECGVSGLLRFLNGGGIDAR